MSSQSKNGRSLLLSYIPKPEIAEHKEVKDMEKLRVIQICGGLTLAGCQVPTKAALSLPSSAGQGRENIMKSLCIKVRTGRDHSATTVMGKTDLGKLTLFIYNQIREG